MTLLNLLITILSCMCAFSNGCSLAEHDWNPSIPVPDHLYSYSSNRVLNDIKAQGFSRVEFDADVWRNASGTRFFVSKKSLAEPIFVFSIDGSANPSVVKEPERAIAYWIDDNACVFAWAQGDGVIRFKDGSTFELPAGTEMGFDDSGQVMFVHDKLSHQTSLYHLSSLTQPAAQYYSHYPPIAVYARNNRTIVYGNEDDSIAVSGRARGATPTLRYFKLDKHRFVETDRIDLPRNMRILDIDTWSSLVLMREYTDIMPDKCFLLDVRTRKITELGVITPGIYLFLAQDILDEDRLAARKASRSPHVQHD